MNSWREMQSVTPKTMKHKSDLVLPGEDFCCEKKKKEEKDLCMSSLQMGTSELWGGNSLKN